MQSSDISEALNIGGLIVTDQGEALRVLLVEDSADDADLILRALSHAKIRVQTSSRVDTDKDLRAILTSNEWDLVLTDWTMPSFNALDVLKIFRESGLDVPVVIVSGMIGETSAVEGMRAGARDYVSKGNLIRLGFVVERERREQLRRESQRREDEGRKVAQRVAGERKRVLALSGEVGLALAEARTLPESLQPCVAALIDHTDAELALIWTLDSDGKMLELQATSGLYRELDRAPSLGPVPVEKNFVARESRSHCTNNYIADPECFDKEFARKNGFIAYVGHPLFVDEKLVGVMELFSREPFSDVMTKSLAAISDTIAVGIRRKSVELENRALEQQLRQAQKMEAVGRLAGGVAHDFNNLLSVILSYGDLILDDLPLDSAIRPDLEEIRRAGQRAAELTKQLLLFSRQQVLEPRVLDLNDVLANTKKMLERIVGEDVTLVFNAAPHLSRVRLDPGSIEQVIMNLVVNARDAMSQGGGGRITIETLESPPFVVLSVSDTGSGMTAETQARMFEPFFSTKGQGKGTGLGLSTVFGIIERSGGTIRVESAPKKGTTFRICLPAFDGEAEDERPTGMPTVGTLRGSETILLVEDEDQVRAVVRGILRRHGYEVIEASNAGEALLASETTSRIDLLLTDVVMPRMNGPELAKRLLKMRPEMKVLCMSGYTDEELFKDVVASGFAYLQKPITPPTLALRVREVIEMSTTSMMPKFGALTSSRPR